MPLDQDHLEALPGIGRSTAGAILAIAGGQRGVILDGNVKRVLCRVFAVKGWPGKSGVARQLWALADECTPERRVADYTQAIMDLGATLCRRGRPDCERCPLISGCQARALDQVSAFPESRPRKPLPVREACMLILENDQQEILLERQPSPGIWGGLWSLPRYETQAEALSMLACQFPDYVPGRELDGFSHRFTHFQLDIQPVHVRVKNHSNAVMEAGQRVWYKTGFELPGGLPKPVSQLLQTLKD
jgi:A/G-specific adenine glycosylase